ncbi:MAG: ATP-dependent DNA helicase [Micrococcus sp.]|nr:ATP-dependent DNA helicase [Micrococcus sp.]
MTPANARYTPQELAARLDAPPPTSEQVEVISAALGPRLVVAGAGSGKTATMADRVVWLVANGMVRPEQILGVTFTRKAAGELAHRIQTKIDALVASGLHIPGWDPGEEDLGRAEVATYHSYAAGLVRDHGLRIGVEPGAALIGAAESTSMVTALAHQMDLDVDLTAPSLSTLVQGTLRLASDMAEHLRTPQEVTAFLADVIARGEALPPATVKGHPQGYVTLMAALRHRGLMAELAGRYAEAKAEAEVMDFGDLLRHAARIAATVPVASAQERERFPVVLLDEFQDTSHAQLEIFAGLFGGASPGGPGHCVSAVGDPHQSIYGFRGASAGQLFSFPARFPTAERERAPISHLTRAWRNDRAILALANRVVEPLSSSAEEAGIAVRELVAREGAEAGAVILDEHQTSDEEATALAERFRELEERAATGSGTLAAPGTDGQPAASRLPSRAILCRARDQFVPILAALDQAGLTYEVLGLTGLLTLPEVTEVLAVLHVIADPARSDHLVRWLAGPRWRIGPADLAVLAQRARFLHALRTRGHASQDEEADESVLLEALDDLPSPRSSWRAEHDATFSEEGLARLRAARAELRLLARHSDLSPAELIAEIVRVTGLDIELSVRPSHAAGHGRRHLNAVIDAARQFSARQRHVPSSAEHLRAFLAWVDAAVDHEHGLGIDSVDPDPTAISVLTAHASKGLEWDIVAVPGLTAGQFPSDKAPRWMGSQGGLPWPLRGDRHAMPQWEFDWVQNSTHWVQSTDEVKSKATQELRGPSPDYKAAVREHALADERRLAYVAFTRARHELWLSGTAWKGRTAKDRQRSEFFLDAQALADTTDGVQWGQRLDPDTLPENNPAAVRTRAAWWPFDPLDGPQAFEIDPDDPDNQDLWRELPARSQPRRDRVEAAARAVNEADLGLLDEQPEVRDAVAWAVRRERALLQADDAVALPPQVSVSLFGELAADPVAVAEQLRRPLPRPPARSARRGTAFHTWLEQRFEASGMLDLDDAHDYADHWVDDAHDLAAMQEWFLSSRWADRVPVEVEAAVETTVAGLSLRGRLDAVYRTGGDPQRPYDPAARWELVDWKTGAIPRGRDARLKALQLAVYRLAFSRLHGIPLEQIEASFVYVAHGHEERVTDLADEAELEEILRSALSAEPTR